MTYNGGNQHMTPEQRADKRRVWRTLRSLYPGASVAALGRVVGVSEPTSKRWQREYRDVGERRIAEAVPGDVVRATRRVGRVPVGAFGVVYAVGDNSAQVRWLPYRIAGTATDLDAELVPLYEEKRP